MADELARRGASLHPVVPAIANASRCIDRRLGQVAFWIFARHKAVAEHLLNRDVETTLAKERRGQQRHQRQKMPPLEPDQGGQRWERRWQMWECSACKSKATSALVLSKRFRQNCPGPSHGEFGKLAKVKGGQKQRKLGHASGCTWCSVCVCFTHSRIHGLGKVCRGRPAPEKRIIADRAC